METGTGNAVWCLSSFLLPLWYREISPQLTLSRAPHWSVRVLQQVGTAACVRVLKRQLKQLGSLFQSGLVRAILSLPRDDAAPHSKGGSVSAHL